MDKFIGKRLDGRYEIQEMIGVGGMANVYKARDIMDDKVVAVKILREEYMTNEQFTRMFQNESKAIAILSHPNIVKVYDVIFTERVQSIVMEYIDGITLKEYIDQQKVLRWKEAVYFTTQMLRALNHAHSKGIVHRDIKPHNIMLLSDGTVKMMDFGIASFARSEARSSTDKAIGSVHYISPEQAQGGGIDGKSDIYSVGIVLFEMLTGQLPFEAETPVSVAIKQIQNKPVPPSRLNPSIPKGLEEITMKAMEKDPSQRYRSAAEMLADIDAFKRDPNIEFSYQQMESDEPDARAVEAARRDQSRRQRSYSQELERRRQEEQQKGRSGSKPSLVSEGVYGFGDKAVKGGESGLESRQDRRLREREEGKERKKKEMERRSVPYQPIERVRIQSHALPVLGGIALAFVVATAIFIFALLYYNDPFSRTPETSMPNLVGLDYEEIRDSDQYDFIEMVVDGEPAYHEQYGRGVIYDQLPLPGKSIKEGAVVKVKVSSGTKQISLPSYVREEATEVYNRLHDLGLEYTSLDVNDDSIPKGYVVRTVPEAGTTVPAGQVVTVYVSLGSDKKMVEVPNLKGLNIENAQTMLETFNLKLGNISTVEDTSRPEGTVIAQNPQEGSQLLEGSTVDLNVCSGGESSTSTSRIMTIELPSSVNEICTVQATQDGVEKHRELLNPREVGSWKISFTGDGSSNIKVLIDNKLYMEYSLNFEENTYRVLTDNSGNF